MTTISDFELTAFQNSINGQAYGFRVSFLAKLTEIKTNNQTSSLLAVIVEQYEREHKELKFLDELKNLDSIVRFEAGVLVLIWIFQI